MVFLVLVSFDVNELLTISLLSLLDKRCDSLLQLFAFGTDVRS